MLTGFRNRIASAARAFRNPHPSEAKNFPLLWHSIHNGVFQWHLVNYDAYVAEGYNANEIVYSAIRYKTDALASVQLRAYQGGFDNPEPAPPEHELSRFAMRPNSFQSMIEFMQQAFTYLDLHGNCFIYVLGLTGAEPLTAYTLRPDRVSITPQDDGTVVYFYLPEGGSLDKIVPILPENMLHIRYPNPGDPYEGQGYGLSPMSAAARTIDVDNYMTRFLGNFFSHHGIMPGGVIELPFEADSDEMQKLRQQFVEEYGGVDEWGKPLVVDQGGKYRRTGMNLDEMGIETIDKRSVQRGVAPFGVPAMLLGLESDSQTFANYEQAESSFWTRTMYAALMLYQVEFQFRLVLGDGVWLAYDLSGIPAFQESIVEQTSVYVSLVNNFVPPNTAAQVAGLPIPKLPLGDVSYRPMGLQPVLESDILPPVEEEPATAPASDNGAVETQEEQEEFGEEAANPIREAVRKARWDSEEKMRIGKQLDRIAERNEAAFRKIVKEQFNRELRAILGILHDAKRRFLSLKASVNYNEITQLINQYMQLQSPQAWREAISPAVVVVVQESRVHWIRELGLSDEIGTFSLRHIESEAWFNEYMLRFGREVTATTRDDIHLIIAQSLADGEGVDVIANRMDLLFDQYITGNTNTEDWAFIQQRRPAYRLEMIARTETHRAAQAGSHTLFQRAGIRLKEWLATGDKRTRDTHMVAWNRYSEGGQPGPIPVNEPFEVGSTTLMYPGDAAGSIEETIQCRCVELPVVE